MSFVKTMKEYLDVAVKGIQNGDKIIGAMIVASQVKNGKVSPEILAEILKRKDICAGCEFNSENAKKNGYTSGLEFVHCILCKCKIQTDDSKEYCLDCNCGITEWNKRNELDQRPLKWEAFKEEEKNQ